MLTVTFLLGCWFGVVVTHFVGKKYLRYKLAKIQVDTNEILTDITRDPERHTTEAINWANLRCVEVQHATGQHNDVLYLIEIEEAASDCPILHSAVTQALESRGHTKFCIRTEW